MTQEYTFDLRGDQETHTWVGVGMTSMQKKVEAVQLFWRQYMPASEYHYQGLTMSVGPTEISTRARRSARKQ